MVNSDSDLMALLVPAVNWKFLFMFIVEITLCSFIRLNGMIKGMLFLMSKKKKKKKECYSSIDHQEREMASAGGISAKFRLFYVSEEYMFSHLYKFYH